MMRIGVLALVLVLAGCSQAFLDQPSYEEKLGWAHLQGLSLEGATSEGDGWIALLQLNDRCQAALTFESDNLDDPGTYRLAIKQGDKVLDTIQEDKISAFAADFKKGNVTTAVKEACLS